ncbi:MAG: phage baseplate assembly protein V [Campylobacteraceae bacterium]|jgi:phage baseplate assembly protein V|nr:phage baseplate assembly protein V [Campylobacteraceae bacterium]
MNNLARFGTITEVQGEKARVKLAEKLVTDFLPVVQFANSFKQKWEPIRPGEQCFVLPNLGDINAGLIIRGVYFTALSAPSTSENEEVTTYTDGTTISYNTEAKVLNVSLAGNATINVASDANITVGGNLSVKAATANIECPATAIKGNVTVEGIVTAASVVGATVTVGTGANASKLTSAGGEFTIEGNLKATGNVKSGNIVSDKWGALRTQAPYGGA